MLQTPERDRRRQPEHRRRGGRRDGVVTGNESGTLPYGDVYREGADILSVWLERDGDDITAHIRIAELSAAQPNLIVYVLWDYAGSDAVRTRRWASGRLKGYGNVFTYGYFGQGATGSAFLTDGETTGRIVVGSPGEIVIDLPKGGTSSVSGVPNDDWGAPAAGSTLGNLVAESRILLGSPEPLPPPPPVRHGFVGVADDTTDATSTCDSYVDAPAP